MKTADLDKIKGNNQQLENNTYNQKTSVYKTRGLVRRFDAL